MLDISRTAGGELRFVCTPSLNKFPSDYVLFEKDDIKSDRYTYDDCDFQAEYVDITFDGKKDIDKKIIIVSKNIDSILKKKYESQYTNITFITNDSFHDRFIIIDRKKLYISGSSFKDIGKKCFGINEFNDNDYIKKILEAIEIM